MMERREDVLKQALDKNAIETERWQAYRADNEIAIQNLDTFTKNLTVEVMVPIGKKALMPGQLIHTNELLVGHYQGYFSACSAHKATEICQYRLRQADEHLKQLQVEADLWQNNLQTPVLEGAVPSAGEIEIVEEFNETEHKNWLEQHKQRVRKEKQEERKQRESYANDDDVLSKLEDREIMAELELDPNHFLLPTLFRNEAKTEIETQPENKNCVKASITDMTDEQVFEILDKLEAQEQNVEEAKSDTEYEQNVQTTNELVRNLLKEQLNVMPAKQRIGKANNSVEKPNEDIEENDTDEEGTDQPEEVKLIREQIAILPSEERVEFLDSQLQIIKAKMRQKQKVSFISDELTHLMNVVVCLEDDLQELLFEQGEMDSTEEVSEDAELLPDVVDNKKRRISFAESNEQLIFEKFDPVAEMLTKGNQQQQQQQREVVKLDAPLQPVGQTISKRESTSPQIMQKVEQNLEFVKENQSVQDFDLVNKILEATTGRINTLRISFNHSEATTASEPFDKTFTPGNPAHFYQLHKIALAEKCGEKQFPIYVNSFEGEEELKVPILKEEDRAAAYHDPRLQFSKFPATSEQSAGVAAGETKSILRNKSAVEHEIRAKPANNQSKKNRTRKNKTGGDQTAYQMVMQQDLVEKQPTSAEPLPKGKFSDALAPKKRISRFKEQRSMNKT